MTPLATSCSPIRPLPRGQFLAGASLCHPPRTPQEKVRKLFFKCHSYSLRLAYISFLAGLDPTNIDNLPYLWHQGQDFLKDGLPIKLIYRMATIEDVRAVDAPRETRELWKAGSGPQGGVRKVGCGLGNELPDKS